MFELSEPREGGRVFVSGAITAENVERVVEAVQGTDTTELDFSGVSSIQLAAVRALMNARHDQNAFCVVNATPAIALLLHETGFASTISVLREFEEYDMTGTVEFGGGHNAVSYWSADGDCMIKLYKETAPESEPQCEMRYSSKVLNMGIPTPIASKLIKVGGRKGVIFEKVKGKKSLSRLIADDPQNIGAYVNRLVDMAKLLHSTPCDTAVFPSQIERLLSINASLECFDAAEKAKIDAAINKIEPQTVCCHGDLHIGNVIVTPAGESLLIDLPDFCYGNPLMDLGALYFACHYLDEALADELYHVSLDTMARVWDLFAAGYFGADTSEKLAAVDEQIKPYAALQALPWLVHGVDEHLMGVMHANLLDL